MTAGDDIFDCDFEIARRPPEPPPFVCLICERPAQKPTRFELGWTPRERELICMSCSIRWGFSTFSFSDCDHQNWHTVRQLSAIINKLQWEIRNGHDRHRHSI